LNYEVVPKIFLITLSGLKVFMLVLKKHQNTSKLLVKQTKYIPGLTVTLILLDTLKCLQRKSIWMH